MSAQECSMVRLLLHKPGAAVGTANEFLPSVAPNGVGAFGQKESLTTGRSLVGQPLAERRQPGHQEDYGQRALRRAWLARCDCPKPRRVCIGPTV